MRCWTLDSEVGPLPPGLPGGAEVKVLRTGTQPQTVTVEDAAGTQWSVQQWQLDCGWLCQLEEEEWFPESDPQVLAVLETLLQEARTRGTAPAFGSEHQISVGELEWILRRNGHQVAAS